VDYKKRRQEKEMYGKKILKKNKSHRRKSRERKEKGKGIVKNIRYNLRRSH
jgi:hypothetical protein